MTDPQPPEPTPWPAEMPFAVRAWPVDASAEAVYTGYWATLTAALEAGMRDARDHERFRGVQVIDQSSTLYAQFNLLWMVPGDIA